MNPSLETRSLLPLIPTKNMIISMMIEELCAVKQAESTEIGEIFAWKSGSRLRLTVKSFFFFSARKSLILIPDLSLSLFPPSVWTAIAVCACIWCIFSLLLLYEFCGWVMCVLWEQTQCDRKMPANDMDAGPVADFAPGFWTLTAYYVCRSFFERLQSVLIH